MKRRNDVVTINITNLTCEIFKSSHTLPTLHAYYLGTLVFLILTKQMLFSCSVSSFAKKSGLVADIYSGKYQEDLLFYWLSGDISAYVMRGCDGTLEE